MQILQPGLSSWAIHLLEELELFLYTSQTLLLQENWQTSFSCLPPSVHVHQLPPQRKTLTTPLPPSSLCPCRKNQRGPSNEILEPPFPLTLVGEDRLHQPSQLRCWPVRAGREIFSKLSEPGRCSPTHSASFLLKDWIPDQILSPLHSIHQWDGCIHLPVHDFFPLLGQLP